MVSLSEFQRAVGAIDGQCLETSRDKRRFTIRLTNTGLEYTPEASGKPRPDRWEAIERVLHRYNETQSLTPRDFQDITRHSSYLIAILRHLFPSAATGAPPAAGAVSTRLRASDAAPLGKPNKPHQRVGSVSNAHVGADFERVALEFFAKQGISLSRNFSVELGMVTKKARAFDLGSSKHKILVECKSHRWTEGARVPSAKMTVWNEAMYYFSLAPHDYRKILFVLHDRRGDGGESLLAYYKRTYPHLIPEGVEFMEWDEVTGEIVQL